MAANFEVPQKNFTASKIPLSKIIRTFKLQLSASFTVAPHTLMP
jgi:hypothetical protein